LEPGTAEEGARGRNRTGAAAGGEGKGGKSGAPLLFFSFGEKELPVPAMGIT